MSRILDAHIAHLRRINNRPATIRDRRNTLLRLTAFLDGRPPLDAAQLHDLERWQDWQRTRVSTSTMRTYTAHVRALYQWACDSGRLDGNPARYLVSPKLPHAKPRPIPDADLRVALRTARRDVLPMLVLGAYLGLRAGEIAAIRGEDVLRDGGTWLIVHGKGGHERVVPLDDALVRVIAPWIGRRGPMFRTARGLPATSRQITEQVSAHFRALGMSYTTHQLRHRAATRLLQLTQNLRQVQEVLGHADPRTTAGYTQMSNAETVAAMGLLAADLARDAAPLRSVVDDADPPPVAEAA